MFFVSILKTALLLCEVYWSNAIIDSVLAATSALLTIWHLVERRWRVFIQHANIIITDDHFSLIMSYHWFHSSLEMSFFLKFGEICLLETNFFCKQGALLVINHFQYKAIRLVSSSGVVTESYKYFQKRALN